MKKEYERYLDTYTRIASSTQLDIGRFYGAPETLASFHAKNNKAPISYDCFIALVEMMGGKDEK